MEMIASRNSVTDSLADTSLSSSTLRTATTVSMEHAVPELRITPEVCSKFLFLLKSSYILFII
jgi:hypothetical protein